MNIVAINSSHRGRKGFTQMLLDQMQTGAREAGAQFETVVLAEQRLNRCLGCEACHAGNRRLHCVYEDKDDMKSILDKMSQSDILIYATPIYVFNMSGLMKTFIDRLNATSDIDILKVSKSGLLFHHIDASICSKPFVLLATCGNIENETVKNVVSYFRTYSKFMDAPIAGVLVRNASFLLERKNGDELPCKPDVLKAFGNAGRELAVTGKISRNTQKQAARRVIEIPSPVRALMKIRPIKGALIREGLKRFPQQYR